VNWTEEDLRRHQERVNAPVSPQRSPLPAAAPAPRQKITRPPLNKWEAAYAERLRIERDITRTIDWFGFEAYSLRLAAGARFTPDFAVRISDRLEFHEVKGFWREAALVRIKVAAELYPWHKFVVVRKQKVSEGGGWEIIRTFN
jgi:hypothetical protein